MLIRIIDVALDNVDVIVDEENTGSVENHKLIPKKLLLAFLNDWLDFVSRVLAEKSSRPEDKRFDSEIAAKLERYGKTLRTLLFPSEMSFTDVRELTFSMDLAWVRLPLELLPLNRVTENFAGLQIPVLRQIRTVQRTSLVTGAKKAETRFLLLANTEGSDDIAPLVEKETYSLKNISAHTVDLKVLGRLTNAAQVIEELTHCEYVHYAGHIRNQSLRLSEGVLNGHDIAALGLGHIKLAFVNGCNSAGEHGETGLARAFLSAGVKNYIGYNYPISDAAALLAAETVWGDFLRCENLSSSRRFLSPRRKKALAEIALSLRRALFEKFGAAELAWLGIQFYINPQEHKSEKDKRFITAAAALVVIAVTAILFIFRVDLASKSAEKQLKTPLPQTVKDRSKKAVNPSEPLMPTEPLYEKPTVIAVSPRREKPSAIQSPALANLVADFRTTAHPYYTNDDKERILSEVLGMDVPESSKIIRLRNEMP